MMMATARKAIRKRATRIKPNWVRMTRSFLLDVCEFRIGHSSWPLRAAGKGGRENCVCGVVC
jgi:hypothetical protein